LIDMPDGSPLGRWRAVCFGQPFATSAVDRRAKSSAWSRAHCAKVRAGRPVILSTSSVARFGASTKVAQRAIAWLANSAPVTLSYLRRAMSGGWALRSQLSADRRADRADLLELGQHLGAGDLG
jgi:hypothetical protein